ncbi:hypothetical protein [Selenomonas sp. oral taxon 136]|uniref:hypothetical protein n=1 Tax=Selenomonas sp. oral taxon 136 TaxID=713030 RepID=UPI000AB78336|nr:hypothetical protein [Selenomonas sp. oral taxon 136]
MEEIKRSSFRGLTEIVFEINSSDGRMETVQEIIEKIREANKECRLRVEVKGITRVC